MTTYKPRVQSNSHRPGVDPGTPDHDPELYAAAAVAQALPASRAITGEHLDFFRQEGYLAVQGFFSAEEVEEAEAGLMDLIMGRVPAFQAIAFEAKAAKKIDALSCEERQDAVRKLAWFVDFEERLRSMALNDKLAIVLERILGEAPKLVQDMALIKPPRIGREKPWHQDHAYFDYSLGTRVVGVWIALDSATVENGCMHVQPRGHQSGPVVHFQRRDWQICDTDIMGKPCVAVPLQPGGVLFFDSLLPHGTPSNSSPHRRKAVQFHYAGESAQACPAEERMAVFGSEGKDVEC